MLCRICLNALQDPDKDASLATHHKTFADLRQSSAACKLCFALWDFYSEAEKIEILKSDVDRQSLPANLEADSYKVVAVTSMLHLPGEYNDIPGDCFEFWLSSFVSTSASESGRLIVFRLTPVDESIPEIDESITSSASTNSEDTWTLVNTWTKQCSENHATCNEPEDSEWKPNRLLDIDHERGTARLVETAMENVSGPYVTLSYRWQTSTCFMLNAASETVLKKGFPIGDMPKSFQDAVTVCCHLSISYLWIDAICIRQDSGDLGDWETQSLLMDKVYSLAFLNIAAEAARDGSHTFFAERDPRMLQHPIVAAALAPDATTSTRYSIQSRRFWNSEIEEAPLNHRAWVLQEKLLARRVLHFGRNQVAYECREHIAAESYPNGCPNIDTHDIASKYHFAHWELYGQTSERRGAYSIWEAVLASYSKCALSHAQDKLMALAGLAKHVAKLIKPEDQYVAGMWKRDLEAEMLWIVNKYIHGPKRPAHRLTNYTAPSWSTASIDAHILYTAQRPARYLWKVIDTDMRLVTDDPMGSLTEGSSLRLRCPLVKLRVTDKRRYEPWAELREFELPSTNDSKTTISMNLYWDEADQIFNPTGHELYCAAAKIQEHHTTGKQTDMKCLMLRLVDPESGTYSRCGHASPYREEDLRPLQAAYEQAERLPCCYREGKEYVIRLI